MRRQVSLAIASVLAASACNVIIGADTPMLRQVGEPCHASADCMSNLCIVDKCGTLSADGGPCGKASDCSNTSDACKLCKCTPCATPGSCADFVACGQTCGVPCEMTQPCVVDGDCDIAKGLACDVARAQCVSVNCKNPDGTFTCGVTTCAPCGG